MINMGSVSRFSAVNAKVRVLEGRMVNEKQISELLKCRSYKEGLYYLADNTVYGQALKHYHIEDIHRGQLENILKKEYVKIFDKFTHYFTGDYKELIKIFFIRFEADDIKVIIRNKFIKKFQTDIETLAVYGSPLSTVDYDKLIKADSIEKVINELKDTVYFKYISNLSTEIYKEGFFIMETALDSVFFLYLKKFINKLAIEDREILKRINGINIDLINLQWIFRAKKSYELTPEVILARCINEGHKLRKDKLKDLSYAKSIDEFYTLVETTYYKSIFLEAENKEYLLEREMLSYLKNLFLKYKREYKTNISVLVSYFELSYMEMRDIISIIENIRYNNESEEAKKYLTSASR
jgi:V/A-type H+-transporting ATPase subunit C